MMAYTNHSLRAVGIANFLGRRQTHPPRRVLDEFELDTVRYGRLPVAVESRRDHQRERATHGKEPRWIIEIGMPSLYIDVECQGLHGATEREAYAEALQRQRELYYAQLMPQFGREFQTPGGTLRGTLVEMKLLASGVMQYGLSVPGHGVQWVDEMLVQPVGGK